MNEFAKTRDAVEDLAVDFVEGEVGRFGFQKNWGAWKARQNGQELAYVRRWLERLGEPTDLAADVLARVDEMHADKVSWIDR